MAEFWIVRQGDSLYAANESDLHEIRKLPIGKPIKNNAVVPRNLQFHRKSFALLNLAFEYWKPATMVSEVERQTVESLKRYMAHHGVSGEAIDALCLGFINHLDARRDHAECCKDFDSFREYVTVKAGFFKMISSPAGPRRVAKSISFAAMDGADFDNYYRQILNVCWQLCLHSVFQDQEQLADQLLRFE